MRRQRRYLVVLSDVPREDHVNGDGEVADGVAVGDLDVLDLGRLPGLAFNVRARLDAHELQLDGADVDGALLDRDLALESL